MIRQDARAAVVGEVVNLPFDFQKYLGAGETITSTSATASVFSGTDTNPTAILTGARSVSGSIVTQPVTPAVVGCIYSIEVTAITSGGQTLISETTLSVVQESGV